MKKLFIAILAFFYLAVASGVTVNLHYCMGELASVEYGHSDESGECGKCGMPDNNNACCHTESDFIKLQDDHQAGSLHFSAKQPEVIQSFEAEYTSAISAVHSSMDYTRIHAPPNEPSNPIYLQHCVFRI